MSYPAEAGPGTQVCSGVVRATPRRRFGGVGLPLREQAEGANASSNYWSATSNADNPNNAWNVNFNDGNVNNDNKTNTNYVRAVRGGSCRRP